METFPDATRMRLVGGDLALDFINTRSGPPVGPPDDDVLIGYADLVSWGAYAGALTQADSAKLRRLASRDPVGAEAVFARSLRMRHDLDSIFRPLASRERPNGRALSRLRDAESDAIAHAHLERGSAFEWTWREDRSLARPLRVVAHAAVQLLTTRELDRLKVCGGCRFVFIDESKNRSRRWCSMDDCGTTEKVRRYVTARRERAARGAV